MNADAWAAERAENEERRSLCREHGLRLDEQKVCTACALRNRSAGTHASV